VRYSEGSDWRVGFATALLALLQLPGVGSKRARCWGSAIGVGWAIWNVAGFFTPVFAEHEADHRFTVEGFVCGNDGRPVAETEVIVKDTRASVGKAGYTDGRGYYKVTLHLHNDNLGDPILVMVRDQEQRVTARFDPKDAHTERKVAVNFGSGCEQAPEGPHNWVYYSIGVGLAAVAAFAGAKWIRKHRRPFKQRGKGARKQRES